MIISEFLELTRTRIHTVPTVIRRHIMETAITQTLIIQALPILHIIQPLPTLLITVILITNTPTALTHIITEKEDNF